MNTVSSFIGSREQIQFLGNNLIIEKRSSRNWLSGLYKSSILGAFLAVLSSNVGRAA
jgi:hypothetical protein